MIDLLESEEQAQITGTVRDFLAEKLPVGRLRRSDSATDHAVWSELAELGIFGLSLPEESGGAGLGLADDVLVFREIGRACGTPSILASWAAARLAAAGDGVLADRLVAGQARACIGIPLAAPGLDGRLDGETVLLDPAGADLAMILTGEDAFLYDLAALGPLSSRRTLDWTLPAAVVRPAGVAARIAAPGSAVAMGADLLVSAMLTGTAEAARDLAVDYAKVREQFGQPIGSFQAVKHHCANTAVRCEAAWAQTIFAALATDAGDGSAAFDRHGARILCGMAAIQNGEDCIQVHGGIGFTADCDAQVFLKRAHALERIGRPARRQLGDMLAMPHPAPRLQPAA